MNTLFQAALSSMFRFVLYVSFLAVFSGKTIAQTPGDSVLVAAYNQALNDYREHYKGYFGKGKQVIYSDFLKPEQVSNTNRKHYKMMKEKDLYLRCEKKIQASKNAGGLPAQSPIFSRCTRHRRYPAHSTELSLFKEE